MEEEYILTQERYGRLVCQDESSMGLSVSKTVQVIVGAVNDGPTITGRRHLAAEEDTTITVEGIRVKDPDCDDAPRGVIEVSIAASNGTVHFGGSVAGLYLMEAPPGTLKIRGKTGPVNAALTGLDYTGVAEFSGEDTLVFTVDDLGHSGMGRALKSNFSLHITVEAVNDPPIISSPAEFSSSGVLFVMEDQLTPLGRFEISDPDNDFVRVQVSTIFGRVDADEIGALSSLKMIFKTSEPLGNGSSVTLEGALGEVDKALAKLAYTSPPNWNSVIKHKRDTVKVRPHNQVLTGNKSMYHFIAESDAFPRVRDQTSEVKHEGR